MSIIYNAKLVLAWAEERNLIKGSTPIHQYLKLIEEFHEMHNHIMSYESREVLADDIGDQVVVAVIMMAQLGFEDGPSVVAKALVKNRDYGDALHLVKSDCLLSMARYLARGDKELAKAALTNHLHRLGALCRALHIDPSEAFRCAYNEIKCRKGKMVDGVYVKEADLV